MAVKWFPGKDRKSVYGPDYKSVDAGPKPDYAGAVLSTFSRSERVMSDVWEYHSYARVWDGEKVIDVYYASDYGPSKDAEVSIDATDEVKALAAAYDAAVEAKKDKARRAEEVDRRVRYAMKLEVGKDVVVVKGRKVKKGTAGRVFWMGEGKWGVRVGLTDAAGATHWTAASNVEVSNPDEHMDVEWAMAYAA